VSAVETLLGRILEYAGLFSAGGLEMESALRNYQRYAKTDEFWILGGFVLPATRLEEFAGAFERVWGTEQERPWTLKVVCAGETAETRERSRSSSRGRLLSGAWRRRQRMRGREGSAGTAAGSAGRYVEFRRSGLEKFCRCSRSMERRQRSDGGLTAETIPAADVVARFLMACARERVAWKATAGLHHAVRGVRV